MATDELGVSSLHMTFNTAEEHDMMKDMGFMSRTGIQYHWDNEGYSTFDDFLAALKQSKRKSIRQVVHTVSCLLCWPGLPIQKDSARSTGTQESDCRGHSGSCAARRRYQGGALG